MVEKYVQRSANLYSNVGGVLQKSVNPPTEDVEYRSVPSFPPPPSLAVAVSRCLLCLRGFDVTASLLGDDMIGGREHVKEVFIELPEGLDIAGNGQ